MHPELFRIGSFALPSYGFMMAVGLPRGPVAPAAARPVLRHRGRDGVGHRRLAAPLGPPRLEAPPRDRRVAAPTSARGADFASLARAGGVFYGGLIGARPRDGVPPSAAPDLVLDVRGRRGALRRARPGVRPRRLLPRGLLLGPQCALPWAVTFTTRRRTRTSASRSAFRSTRRSSTRSSARSSSASFSSGFERRAFSGETFARYVFGYALLRGTIEFFRGDPRGEVLGVMSTSQFIALCGVLAAARDLRPAPPDPARSRSRRERRAAAGPDDPRGPGGRGRAHRPRPAPAPHRPPRGLAHEDPGVDRRGLRSRSEEGDRRRAPRR